MSTAPNTVKKAGNVATFEEIKAAGIKGNHFQDMPAIWACCDIIANPEVDMETRKEVSDYLNHDIMGLDSRPTTEDDVNKMEKDHNEHKTGVTAKHW